MAEVLYYAVGSTNEKYIGIAEKEVTT